MVLAARGKEYAEWERMAALLCVIANVNRDPQTRRRPYSPHDFFRRPGVKQITPGQRLDGSAFRALKAVFVKKR